MPFEHEIFGQLDLRIWDFPNLSYQGDFGTPWVLQHHASLCLLMLDTVAKLLLDIDNLARKAFPEGCRKLN